MSAPSAPDLVLVHGSPATGQAWQPVAKHLGGRFNITTPTLPGHEGSGPIDEPPPIATDTLAAAVEDEIGPRDVPFMMAAHSYGASVAFHVAMRGRLPVRRLVMFEPVSPHALEVGNLARSLRVFREGIGGYVEAYERGEPVAVRRMIDFWFGADAFEAMPDPVKTYLIDRTPVNVRDVRAAFAETYTRDDIAKLDIPVLIVCGGNSPQVTLDIAKVLTGALPQGRLAMLDGADHAMLTTHAEAVAGLVAEFCS